jgi:hypothetical protein
MNKTQLGFLALLLGVSISTPVFAHDSIGFSVNFGSPYYYGPPPVYYSPPPVVYYEPRPVYREYYSANPNAYYYSRDNRYDNNDGWRGRHGHHGHHEHDDDND